MSLDTCGRHIHGRASWSVEPGNDTSRTEIIEFPMVFKRRLHKCPDHHLHCFAVFLSCCYRIHAKSFEVLYVVRPCRAYLQPSLAENIERGHSLRDTNWVIVPQHHDRHMTDRDL